MAILTPAKSWWLFIWYPKGLSTDRRTIAVKALTEGGANLIMKNWFERSIVGPMLVADWPNRVQQLELPERIWHNGSN